jgi:integrase
MANKPLTDMQVKNIKPTEKVQIISDSGGLVIRVRPLSVGGGLSFMYSHKLNGKRRQMTLKAKTLKEAREERDKYKAMLKAGLDPILEKKLDLEREAQQQLDEQEAITKRKARMTVNMLFIEWCDIDLLDRKDIINLRRMFAKDVLPDLGELFIEDVTKGHIVAVVNKLKKRRVKHLARNVLKLMRQMFRFAVNNDKIEKEPTATLKIAATTTAPTERERVLSEVEIRALARQMPDAHLVKTTEAAVWIALSTVCRIGEISRAKISDVDWDAGTWIIPKENSKNSKAHTIYLSRFALEQFNVLRSLTPSTVWLLPNRNDTGHINDKTVTKQTTSRQTDSPLQARSKDNQALVLIGGKWTPHDLRRTGATIMGNLGVASDVIDKCLNHTEENKLKRVYQRQKLEAEQAGAWRLLGERLELLVNLDAVNVIPLHRGS